jgi:pimeloyl-ACP methyl ester carboxylesterase
MKKTSSPPLVVILHGWTIHPDTHQKWQIFRDELAQRGVKSKMLGIPGLSAPLTEVWGLSDYVAWLEKEVMSEKEVILLGHSFGGQISISYTAQHPEQVKKLLLIDSSGIRDHSFLPTVKRTVFLFLSKMGKVFFRNEKARSLLYVFARERDYHQAPPLLRRTMSKILDDEVLDDLGKITCPTLLIWGREDKVTPLSLGEVFHKKILHSEMKIIDGARHSPQYTHVTEVAEAASQFCLKK